MIIVVAITVKNSFLHVAGEPAQEPHADNPYQTVPDGLKIFHNRYPQIQSFGVLPRPTPKQFAPHLDELVFYKTIYKYQEGKTVNVSDRAHSFGTGDTLIREILDQIAKEYRTVRLDSTAGGAMWVFFAAAHPDNSNNPPQPDLDE